jgi:hypothetical protein
VNRALGIASVLDLVSVFKGTFLGKLPEYLHLDFYFNFYV